MILEWRIGRRHHSFIEIILDLSSVEIFLAVARETSITQAAKIVGRVPSNVTVRIQQLERDLGVCLFSRDGKKMTLTREGKTFLSYANRLIAMAAEARRAVRPSGPAGSLRVGTMESTAASRLPDVLARFHARWPDVSLRLTMGSTRDLTRAVLQQELDCALIAQPSSDLADEDASLGIDLSDLMSRRVFVEDIVIVLPADHPPVRIAADLRVDTLAALEPGCTYRRVAERWCRRAGAVQTMELGSYHAILASVTAGNAVGVMPQSVLDLLHRPDSVKTHALGTIDTLLIRRQDECPAAFDAFSDMLSERAAAAGSTC
jgi:DNA-binding transcriptional LysR family regulator